jgi:hypothetical protein
MLFAAWANGLVAIWLADNAVAEQKKEQQAAATAEGPQKKKKVTAAQLRVQRGAHPIACCGEFPPHSTGWEPEWREGRACFRRRGKKAPKRKTVMKMADGFAETTSFAEFVSWRRWRETDA